MLLISTLLIVAVVEGFEAVAISCEEVSSCYNYNCCKFEKTTGIDSKNITIAGEEDQAVNAVSIQYNKKIQFLPVGVHRKFPNLEAYVAKSASVKEISALNFEKLTNLKILNLQNNQIEFVPNFCFEGLTKIEEISISKY